MAKGLLILVVFFLSAVPVWSEGGASAISDSSQRRGLVTSSTCPLSCHDLGIAESNCRAWQSGDKCQVEDFSQPPGHRSMVKVYRSQDVDLVGQNSSDRRENTVTSGSARPTLNRRGLITSASCPYDCNLARVPEEFCRSWQQGNKCFVEDFSQPAGHRSMIRIP